MMELGNYDSALEKHIASNFDTVDAHVHCGIVDSISEEYLVNPNGVSESFFRACKMNDFTT